MNYISARHKGYIRIITLAIIISFITQGIGWAKGPSVLMPNSKVKSLSSLFKSVTPDTLGIIGKILEDEPLLLEPAINELTTAEKSCLLLFIRDHRGSIPEVAANLFNKYLVQCAEHEVNVSYDDEKIRIALLKRNHPKQVIEIIQNLLNAGNIEIEVQVEDGRVKRVIVQKNKSLAPRSEKFVREQFMLAVQELIRRRSYLEGRIIPDDTYRINISKRCMSLGRLIFTPHEKQNEFEISPWAFLRNVLLQYTLRHMFDYCFDADSKGREKTAQKVIQRDRWFFKGMPMNEQLYLLWMFFKENETAVRGYEAYSPWTGRRDTDDFFKKLIRSFADANSMEFRTTSYGIDPVLWNMIKEYSQHFRIFPEQYKPDMQNRGIAVSAYDVLEYPHILKNFTPCELKALHGQAGSIPVSVIRDTFRRYMHDTDALLCLFLFVSGLDGEKYSRMAGEILYYIMKKTDVSYCFILAFRHPESFGQRDRVIKYLIDRRKNKDDKLCCLLIEYFKEDSGKRYPAFFSKDTAGAWADEYTILCRKKRNNRDVYKCPDYIKAYAQKNGTYYLMAMMRDFSWVKEVFSFDDPDGFLKKRTEFNNTSDIPVREAVDLFFKWTDRYTYIPRGFTAKCIQRYWQGNTWDACLIDIIGNDPFHKQTAQRFLRSVIRGVKEKNVTDARHQKKISIEERRQALKIYVHVLGRDALPHLLEWIKDDTYKDLEASIIEGITQLLTYEEIADSLESYVLDEDEEEHTVYKQTITNTGQAVRHIDICWDRIFLRKIENEEISNNKDAYQDVKQALEQIKTVMPISRKMKFHIIKSDVFEVFNIGNHICISEGALRECYRQACLIYVLAHEISHRQEYWKKVLQGIKSAAEFKDNTGLKRLMGLIEAKISSLNLMSREETIADRQAVETVIRLGYDPDSALDIFRNKNRILELVSGVSPAQMSITHPDYNTRIMNMKGHAVKYAREHKPAKTQTDSVLLFVREERAKQRHKQHAFNAIERRVHDSKDKYGAVSCWHTYIREYICTGFGFEEQEKFSPVAELSALNKYYETYRPFWLNAGEMLIDFMPFELIDRVIQNDAEYQGFSGMCRAYVELGMIYPPDNRYSEQRTARTLYHLWHQDMYVFRFEEWLEAVKPVSARKKKDVYGLFLTRYANTMLPFFVLGLRMAREHGVFGRSFEKDLMILRQLAGLPDDKKIFTKLQVSLTGHGYDYGNGALDSFCRHYNNALAELIEMHNIDLLNPSNKKKIQTALEYCLEPAGVIHCLYKVSVNPERKSRLWTGLSFGVKGKRSLKRKAKIFLKALAEINLLKAYVSECPVSKIWFHTCIEEEAIGLYKELSEAGLMDDRLSKKFCDALGLGQGDEIFRIENYYDIKKAEIFIGKVIDGLIGSTVGAGTRHYRYNFMTCIKLTEWFIREELNYDLKDSLMIIRKLIETLENRGHGGHGKSIRNRAADHAKSIVFNLFENIIGFLESHEEDSVSYSWFDSVYKDLFYLSDLFDFQDEFIDSIEGGRYTDAFRRLADFPEPKAEKTIEEKKKNKRYDCYKSLQKAVFLKKKALYEQNSGRMDFDREMRMLFAIIGRNEVRDELLYELIKRYIDILDAEELAGAAVCFTGYGQEEKAEVVKIAVQKVLEGDNGRRFEQAFDLLLRCYEKRSRYRDELIDYILSHGMFSTEELERYETLKTEFGEDDLEGITSVFVIKSLALISQASPDKKLEALLWLKNAGPRPSVFSIDGRAEFLSSMKMDEEIRKTVLAMSDKDIPPADRFNKEFNRLHKDYRKRFFAELLSRPDGILSDEKVKKQFIENDIWKIFETVDRDSPEGKLIILYLEEADPLISAKVMSEILDISFKGLNSYERLALILQEIGFIGDKTSQWFSVRLRNKDARRAFRDAQRRPRPFSKIEAVKILEDEWGMPIDKVLKYGLGRELGFGSSKGVWEGELLDGRKTAVSVQRPDFVMDMNYQFYIVVRVLERFRRTRWGRMYKGLISETMDVNRAMLEGEKDLRSEFTVRNKLAKTVTGVRIPEVIDNLTTTRVAVTELVQGAVRLNEVEDNETRKRVVKKVINAMVTQLFSHGVFHADPWPSNILVDKDENISFVDFAVGGEISPEYLGVFKGFIKALIGMDTAGIHSSLLNLTERTNGTTPKLQAVSGFTEQDVSEFLRTNLGTTRIVDMWINLLEFLYQHGRRFKPDLRIELAKLLRVLGILEGMEQSCGLQGFLIAECVLCLNQSPPPSGESGGVCPASGAEVSKGSALTTMLTWAALICLFVVIWHIFPYEAHSHVVSGAAAPLIILAAKEKRILGSNVVYLKGGKEFYLPQELINRVWKESFENRTGVRLESRLNSDNWCEIYLKDGRYFARVPAYNGYNEKEGEIIVEKGQIWLVFNDVVSEFVSRVIQDENNLSDRAESIRNHLVIFGIQSSVSRDVWLGGMCIELGSFYDRTKNRDKIKIYRNQEQRSRWLLILDSTDDKNFIVLERRGNDLYYVKETGIEKLERHGKTYNLSMLDRWRELDQGIQRSSQPDRGWKATKVEGAEFNFHCEHLPAINFKDGSRIEKTRIKICAEPPLVTRGRGKGRAKEEKEFNFMPEDRKYLIAECYNKDGDIVASLCVFPRRDGKKMVRRYIRKGTVLSEECNKALDKIEAGFKADTVRIQLGDFDNLGVRKTRLLYAGAVFQYYLSINPVNLISAFMRTKEKLEELGQEVDIDTLQSVLFWQSYEIKGLADDCRLFYYWKEKGLDLEEYSSVDEVVFEGLLEKVKEIGMPEDRSFRSALRIYLKRVLVSLGRIGPDSKIGDEPVVVINAQAFKKSRLMEILRKAREKARSLIELSGGDIQEDVPAGVDAKLGLGEILERIRQGAVRLTDLLKSGARDLKGIYAYQETDDFIKPYFGKADEPGTSKVAELCVEQGQLKLYRVKYVEDYENMDTASRLRQARDIELDLWKYFPDSWTRGRIKRWLIYAREFLGEEVRIRVILGSISIAWNNDIAHSYIMHAGYRDRCIYIGEHLLKDMFYRSRDPLVKMLLNEDELRHLQDPDFVYKEMQKGTQEFKEYKRRIALAEQRIFRIMIELQGKWSFLKRGMDIQRIEREDINWIMDVPVLFLPLTKRSRYILKKNKIRTIRQFMGFDLGRRDIPGLLAGKLATRRDLYNAVSLLTARLGIVKKWNYRKMRVYTEMLTPHDMDWIRDIPLFLFGLADGTINALNKCGVKTAGELLELDINDEKIKQIKSVTQFAHELKIRLGMIQEQEEEQQPPAEESAPEYSVMPEDRERIGGLSVDYLGLSKFSRRKLQIAGIETINDLLGFDLIGRNICHYGEKSFEAKREIFRAAARLKVRLGMEVVPEDILNMRVEDIFTGSALVLCLGNGIETLETLLLMPVKYAQRLRLGLWIVGDIDKQLMKKFPGLCLGCMSGIHEIFYERLCNALGENTELDFQWQMPAIEILMNIIERETLPHGTHGLVSAMRADGIIDKQDFKQVLAIAKALEQVSWMLDLTDKQKELLTEYISIEYLMQTSGLNAGFTDDIKKRLTVSGYASYTTWIVLALEIIKRKVKRQEGVLTNSHDRHFIEILEKILHYGNTEIYKELDVRQTGPRCTGRKTLSKYLIDNILSGSGGEVETALARLSLYYRYLFNAGPYLEFNNDTKLVLVDAGQLTKEEQKLLDIELRRNKNKVFCLFTSVSGIEIDSRFKQTERVILANYDQFGSEFAKELIEFAKQGYRRVNGYDVEDDCIRIITHRSKEMIWHRFPYKVTFLGNRLYIDSSELKQIAEAEGLNDLIQKDGRNKEYIDMTIDSNVLNSIEQDLLTERVIRDEA